MARIVLAIILTVAFVAFALSNTQHVELSCVFGKPIEVRLIFALMISFASGVVATLFYQLVQEQKRRALHRKIRLQLKKSTSLETEHE